MLTEKIFFNRHGFLVLSFCIIASGQGGCSTTPETVDNGYPKAIPQAESKPTESYSTLVGRWSNEEKNYRNFSSTFQVGATLLTPDLIEGQNYLDSEDFHWTPEKLRDEKQRLLFQAESSTSVFIDVYTEKNENNNLDKTKSDWNIFLDVDGKRVLPQSVKRIYDSHAGIINKYPYHTLWARPYMVTFPISSTIAAKGPTKLVIAGPLGSARLDFPNPKFPAFR